MSSFVHSWSRKLIQAILTAFNQPQNQTLADEEIEAEALADRVDRIKSRLYAEKGLEALADAGVIERGDGDTYIA